jgi:hypothetical protein
MQRQTNAPFIIADSKTSTQNTKMQMSLKGVGRRLNDDDRDHVAHLESDASSPLKRNGRCARRTSRARPGQMPQYRAENRASNVWGVAA